MDDQGSKRVAGNYTCDLELRGRNTKVIHRGKVFPIDQSGEEVRWDYQCFQVMKANVKPM